MPPRQGEKDVSKTKNKNCVVMAVLWFRFMDGLLKSIYSFYERKSRSAHLGHVHVLYNSACLLVQFGVAVKFWRLTCSVPFMAYLWNFASAPRERAIEWWFLSAVLVNGIYCWGGVLCYRVLCRVCWLVLLSLCVCVCVNGLLVCA